MAPTIEKTLHLKTDFATFNATYPHIGNMLFEHIMPRCFGPDYDREKYMKIAIAWPVKVYIVNGEYYSYGFGGNLSKDCLHTKKLE